MNKLQHLVEKYNLTNVLKTLAIIIILFLLARLLIPDFKTASNDFIEHFEALGYTYYGNELSLQNPSNILRYSGNTCIIKLNEVYRIENLKLVFNANNNMSDIARNVLKFNPGYVSKIYIQYEDGNGNMKYIKSDTESSPPNFNNDTNITTTTNTTVSSDTSTTAGQSFSLIANNIMDENNLLVYTSKLVITIGELDNRIDKFIDTNGNGYISNFGIWGSSRDLLSKADFERLSPALELRLFASKSNTHDPLLNTDISTFATVNDMLLYGLAINYDISEVEIEDNTTSTSTTIANTENSRNPANFDTTDNPFKLSITYNNGIYSGNNFTIDAKYIIRSDSNRLIEPSNITYIIFRQPIIANSLIITIPRVNKLISRKILKCDLNRVSGYGSVPTITDISTYKRTINALLSASSGQSLDVCPSVDNLISKQNQAQKICDNIEYQDKLKSEKLRLEKNKQYLLKLKQQQEEIDQLNQVITTLDSKRGSREKVNDNVRLLQYQNQRNLSSTVRDLANQRLDSQANNQLHLNVKINNTANTATATT